MFRFRKRQSEHTRVGQIRRLGLFATLQPTELRVVNGLLHERRYLKGEVIFDEGEEGQALYIVFGGKVLICQQGEPETGRIAEVAEGSMFGELALLDGSPRSAQARVAEDCLLAALSRADFNDLVDTHAVIASKIALQLARELGQKLREHFVAMDDRPL
jgi:CRP/FNR family transcriptional regulator, cyclic AMP receptor protein